MATSSFGKPTIIKSNDVAERLAEALNDPTPPVKKTGVTSQIERSDEVLANILSRLKH